MKKVLFFLMGVMVWGAAHAAIPFGDVYQTIDDKTGQPKSIVQLYEYTDEDDVKLAGRIIALYGADGQVAETFKNATRVAENVHGAPKYVGLDIIWDMEWDADDNQYEDGKIMDPQSGKVYSSVIWRDGAALNVRGKIGPFGRTQTWRPLDGEKLPAELQSLNTQNWTPSTGK